MAEEAFAGSESFADKAVVVVVVVVVEEMDLGDELAVVVDEAVVEAELLREAVVLEID